MWSYQRPPTDSSGKQRLPSHYIGARNVNVLQLCVKHKQRLLYSLDNAWKRIPHLPLVMSRAAISVSQMGGDDGLL